MELDQRNNARALSRMKWIATGLLGAMVVLFFVARQLEPAYPWLRFAKAFAEAGMAGGFADWFAVTALFRHPLGLRLPHTAIIPANKHRIAENLGTFFEQNFLLPEVVTAKLAQIDLSGALLRWLSAPGQAEQIAGYLDSLAPKVLTMVDEREAVELIRDALAHRARSVPLQPVAAAVLAQISRSADFDALLAPLLEELDLLFRDNSDLIRRRVREGTGWIWQRISLDEKVADAVIKILDSALEEVRRTPDHPWRRRLGALAHDRLAGLADSPTFLAQLETMREALLAHPMLNQHIAALWRELRDAVTSDIERPESLVRARLVLLIEQGARHVAENAALRARLDQCGRDAILAMMAAHRLQLARLIADTVHGWDTATVTRKLEIEVGSDLQFVRINGTLIGGLVGLVLQALQLL
jgi:uncharacterized membrane-anchored protein YjiN (DUF445 family)